MSKCKYNFLTKSNKKVSKKINYVRMYFIYNDSKTQIGRIKNKKFYTWKSYNNFGKEEQILNNATIIKIPNDIKNEFFCGNNINNINKIIQLSKKKHYFTMFNGGHPFLIYIDKKNAYIYTSNDKIFTKNKMYNKDKIGLIMKIRRKLNLCKNIFYSKLVKKIKFNKIFLGICNKYSVSKGVNSILLNTNKNKFVFILNNIYEFTMKDKIINYYSPIGNSSVPYPFIIGMKYVYFLLDVYKYLNKKYLPNNFNANINGDLIYSYLEYGNKNFEEPLYKYSKKLNNFKLIHNFQKAIFN